MLFCNRGQSSQDECHVVGFGRYDGSFLVMIMILMFLFECQCNFRDDHRGQEGRIH